MRMVNRNLISLQTSCNAIVLKWFSYSLTSSLSTPVKPPKVAHSDQVVRPRFRKGGDAFSTPSSTPLTPSSWPPRHDSTGPSPTRVADHVVSISLLHPNNDPQTPCRGTLRDDLGASLVVLMTRGREEGLSFEFRQVGPYIMKRRAMYFENLCIKRRN